MAAAEKALWFIESYYNEDLSLTRIGSISAAAQARSGASPA